jgi:predicted MPP superfamily phosphohydrolase
VSLADHTPRAETERALEELRHDLTEAIRLRQIAEKRLDVLAKVAVQEPRWLIKPAGTTHTGRGTPVLMLSDLHLDEVVDYAEMNRANKYNRRIAEQRLDRVVLKSIEILRDYWQGTTYDGIVLVLGGDIFSGNIHDELRETNEDTMLGSVSHWIPRIAGAISLLADEFGKVHVPVVAGNHGRSTPKKRYKLNARDNFDWFIGVQLAAMFRDDDRITFAVSDAQDTTFDVYGWRVMLTHGDQTGGGQGIGGIWPPIMRMLAKKQQAQSALGRRFDMGIMGHWHQLTWGQGFIINGSLKGYDEFAMGLNFRPEQAQQALWVMSPERMITWRADVIAEDRKAEGWGE